MYEVLSSLVVVVSILVFLALELVVWVKSGSWIESAVDKQKKRASAKREYDYASERILVRAAVAPHSPSKELLRMPMEDFEQKSHVLLRSSALD